MVRNIGTNTFLSRYTDKGEDMKGVAILCMYNGMLLFDWYINEDIQVIYRYMHKHELI